MICALNCQKADKYVYYENNFILAVLFNLFGCKESELPIFRYGYKDRGYFV